MIKLKHIDSFQIKDRGKVYMCTIKDNPHIKHEDIDRIYKNKEIIEIDNRLW